MHDEGFAALDIADEAALQIDIVEIDGGHRCGRPASRRHLLFERGEALLALSAMICGITAGSARNALATTADCSGLNSHGTSKLG
jgi:hypothetical protein